MKHKQNIAYDGSFVVLDTESTHFSPNNNYGKLLEISAVKLSPNNEVTEEFSTFINPGMKIPPKIVNLTGITDEDVKDAPNYKEAIRAFQKFCAGNYVLVMHNATHDLNFLDFFGAQIGAKFSDYPVVDTFPLAKDIWPGRKSYKLEDLAKDLGIQDDNHHEALNDAKVTAQLLIKEREALNAKPVPWEGLVREGNTSASVNPAASLSQFEIRKINTWESPDQQKHRLYITAGSDNEYAMISYDFEKDEWALDKTRSSIQKVEDFTPIKKKVLEKYPDLDFKKIDSTIPKGNRRQNRIKPLHIKKAVKLFSEDVPDYTTEKGTTVKAPVFVFDTGHGLLLSQKVSELILTQAKIDATTERNLESKEDLPKITPSVVSLEDLKGLAKATSPKAKLTVSSLGNNLTFIISGKSTFEIPCVPMNDKDIAKAERRNNPKLPAFTLETVSKEGLKEGFKEASVNTEVAPGRTEENSNEPAHGNEAHVGVFKETSSPTAPIRDSGTQNPPEVTSEGSPETTGTPGVIPGNAPGVNIETSADIACGNEAHVGVTKELTPLDTPNRESGALNPSHEIPTGTPEETVSDPSAKPVNEPLSRTSTGINPDVSNGVATGRAPEITSETANGNEAHPEVFKEITDETEPLLVFLKLAEQRAKDSREYTDLTPGITISSCQCGTKTVIAAEKVNLRDGFAVVIKRDAPRELTENSFTVSDDAVKKIREYIKKMLPTKISIEFFGRSLRIVLGNDAGDSELFLALCKQRHTPGVITGVVSKREPKSRTRIKSDDDTGVIRERLQEMKYSKKEIKDVTEEVTPGYEFLEYNNGIGIRKKNRKITLVHLVGQPKK